MLGLGEIVSVSACHLDCPAVEVVRAGVSIHTEFGDLSSG